MTKLILNTLKKYLYVFIIVIIAGNSVNAQNIRELAIHPCTDCSYEKHIYALGDTAVYWYNWYYYYYSPYPNAGLVRNSGIVQIDELEAFEDEDLDSKLYVISDTAVFYYIPYYQEWYPLSTEGLNRTDNKPALKSLQVFTDIDGDTRVYVISNDSIMYYEWYYSKWFPLNNPVLPFVQTNIEKSEETDITLAIKYDILTIEIKFPASFSQDYNIDVYDISGKKMFRTHQFDYTTNKVWHQISVSGIAPGSFILSVSSDDFSKEVKFIKP